MGSSTGAEKDVERTGRVCTLQCDVSHGSPTADEHADT